MLELLYLFGDPLLRALALDGVARGVGEEPARCLHGGGGARHLGKNAVHFDACRVSNVVLELGHSSARSERAELAPNRGWNARNYCGAICAPNAHDRRMSACGTSLFFTFPTVCECVRPLKMGLADPTTITHGRNHTPTPTSSANKMLRVWLSAKLWVAPRRTNGTLQEGHLRASRACRLPQCRPNPASQTPRSSLVIILMNSFKLILPSPSTSASAIHALTVSSSTGPSPIVVRASTSSSRSR